MKMHHLAWTLAFALVLIIIETIFVMFLGSAYLMKAILAS